MPYLDQLIAIGIKVDADLAASAIQHAALTTERDELLLTVAELQARITELETPAEPQPTHTYPAGTFTSPGTFPDGAIVQGAGIGKTVIRGRVDFGDGQTFRDLTIAATGDCAVTNSGNVGGTSFVRCQFRGGGGTYATNERAAHVITLKNACHDLAFTDCVIECNLGVETSGHAKHFDNVFIQPAVVAPSITDVVWTRCHFGAHNGVRSGSPRFNVEIWASPSASVRNAGYSGLDFVDCTFEPADDVNLDYSGSTLSTNTSAPNNGPCRVTGCTFKGNGHSYVWYGDLIIESGAGYVTVSDCTFYRGAGQAIAIGGHGGSGVETRCTVSGNVIDGNLDAGIEHDAFEYLTLMSRGNVATGNQITNTNKYRRTVSVSGSGNTVTGNRLVGGALWNGGADNVVTPNEIVA
jgi:hypothetical protein